MDLKCLEYSIIKIPYENLNKKYRNSLKSLDREINVILSCSNEFDKKLKNMADINPLISSLIASTIDSIKNKLELLKIKASDILNDEKLALEDCARRLSHLREGYILDQLVQNHIPSQIKQKSFGLDDSKGGNLLTCTPEKDDSVTCYTAQNAEHINAKWLSWKKRRLDRMLVDYFMRQGYYESAFALAQSSNIKELTNVEIFLMAKEIEQSLLRHQTGPCLAWCHENKSKLRKIKNNVEFELRMQDFIQMYRKGLLLDAIKYCKKFFGSYAIINDTNNDSNFASQIQFDIQRLMGLLAFNPNQPVPHSYQNLLDESRWHKLVMLFRDALYKVYQLDHKQSVFSVIIQAGLASLKTPQCNYEPKCDKKLLKSDENSMDQDMATDLESNHTDDNANCNMNFTSPKKRKNRVTQSTSLNNNPKNNENDKNCTCPIEKGAQECTKNHKKYAKNPKCPICNSKLALVSRNLPYAHSTQSRLLCRISQEILDDKNPPLMLPNGQIYGKKALQAMATQNDNKVTCPITKEIFDFSKVEKVYIM